jgi:asparagine synthase (glutamine-hydrolysing)
MCGIVGIYDRNGGVRLDTLKKAADSLVTRGPDGEGFYISPDATCGFGHRRLSIIDLAGGQQPIANETGDIVAVVNGEFYDHTGIRENLRARGHVFRTLSDSEILLHLYEEYSTECLSHLRGEFAFILHDRTRDILFAARDRFGIKPLCMAEHNDALLLASEAKAIFAMGLPARWDQNSFWHAASLQYTPQDKTLFYGVEQLKPGYALLVERGQKKIFKYWDIDFAAEKDTGAVAITDFHDALMDAIRVRLTADVPVCFHLSGGLDSSAILGMATALTGKSLDAFTVSFDHAGYDELPVAEETARHLNARLHVVRVTQDDLVHEIENAVFHGEGLAINGHLAGKYLLNRAIRAAGFRVALSGEGSDEILAGYPHLRQDLLRHDAANDTTADMHAAIYATNMASAGVQIAYGDMLPLDAVTRRMGYTPAFLEAKAALGLRLHAVLNDGYAESHAAHDSYAALMDAIPCDMLAGRHPVNQSAYIWAKLALANYILRTLGDGMEMAHGVEGRLPFLDHKLFDVVRRLPMDMKIRGMTEKYVLREAARPYLTDTVYRRQKHPFMAPPVARFADDRLMQFIMDHLSGRDFAAVPFFDTKKCRDLLARLPGMDTAERTATEPVLMTLLTASLLQKKFRLAA